MSEQLRELTSYLARSLSRKMKDDHGFYLLNKFYSCMGQQFPNSASDVQKIWEECNTPHSWILKIHINNWFWQTEDGHTKILRFKFSEIKKGELATRPCVFKYVFEMWYNQGSSFDLLLSLNMSLCNKCYNQKYTDKNMEINKSRERSVERPNFSFIIFFFWCLRNLFLQL